MIRKSRGCHACPLSQCVPHQAWHRRSLCGWNVHPAAMNGRLPRRVPSSIRDGVQAGIMHSRDSKRDMGANNGALHFIEKGMLVQEKDNSVDNGWVKMMGLAKEKFGWISFLNGHEDMGKSRVDTIENGDENGFTRDNPQSARDGRESDGNSRDGAAGIKGAKHEFGAKEEIWEEAWSPFLSRARTKETLESRRRKKSKKSNKENRKETLITEDVEDFEELISKPLLWLQGLNKPARHRLLGLTLALIEANFTVLEQKEGIHLLDPSEWLFICDRFMLKCTLEASLLWLGYIPLSLQEACKPMLKEYKNTRGKPSLQKENLIEGSGLLQKEHKTVSEDIEIVDDTSDPNVTNSSRTLWYSYKQRVPLYCGLMCLLCSLENGSQKSVSDLQRNVGFRNSDMSGFDRDGFQQRVQGWKATTGGVKSPSQLLTAAPSVIQDMCILIADAVAESYLSEVSQGHVWNRNGYIKDWKAITESLGMTFLASSDLAQLQSVSRTKGENSRSKFRYEASSIVRQPNKQYEAALCEIETKRCSKYLQEEKESEALSDNLATVSSSNASEYPKGLIDQENGKVDGQTFQNSPLEVSWWPTFAHNQLSTTRRLQRFSNMLIGGRWLDLNIFAVSAMYEDRVPLFTLYCSNPLIRIRHLPMKRTAELARLRGIPYATSLFIEASDIISPLMEYLIKRAFASISWVLTQGIGRALGLIWKGIKIGFAAS